MTITQLQYIVALDTYRNFAAAASHCCVTQPTLSMQIKKLEQELEVSLFDRNKKPVAPTDIGRQVIEQARRSLQSLHKIDELVQSNSDKLSGTLRIGVIPTLSPYLLPRVLPALAAQYPHLTLEIEELLSDQIIDRLYKDLLDVSLWVANKREPQLVNVPLFYERFLVYLPDNHSYPSATVALEELDTEQMWLLREGHCFRDQVATFCGDLLPSRYRADFLSGSLETLRRIVDQHYGFTLLPELAVLDLPKDRQKNVRPFRHIQPLREVSLSYHQRFSKDRLVQALKHEIRASVPAELLDEARGSVVPWQ